MSLYCKTKNIDYYGEIISIAFLLVRYGAHWRGLAVTQKKGVCVFKIRVFYPKGSTLTADFEVCGEVMRGGGPVRYGRCRHLSRSRAIGSHRECAHDKGTGRF